MLGFDPSDNSSYGRLVGGRISNFIEEWRKITSDPWVLSVVQEGLRLNFTTPPRQESVKITKFSTTELEEVMNLR